LKDSIGQREYNISAKRKEVLENQMWHYFYLTEEFLPE